MAMQRRASGVFVEARGGATVAAGALRVRRARLGELAPPAAPGKGRRRAATAPAASPMTEEEAVVNAMEAQDLELLDAIPVAPSPPASARRRGAAAAMPGAAAGELELAVPLAEGESAVVLVDHDGFYEWRLPDTSRAPAEEEAKPQPARRRGAAPARATTSAEPARTAVFRIALRTAPAAPTTAPRRAGRRRGLVTRVVVGQAVAYVFRFLARPAVQGLARFLERNVKEGLVQITAPDPQAWITLADDAPLATPGDRPVRVLLLVHGTFSSTIGSFGALAGQPQGRALLEEALRKYDLVIGWDHRTLGVLPSENAIDLASRLERIGFKQPVVIDAVCFSRGGLVLRSLIEHVIPSVPQMMQVRRAVFVAATNGGTELANPNNWHRLADRYTNLAAAGARAAALVPAFAATATLLAEAIRGVGVLVKVLASVAVTDAAVPGLAAMEPDGEFVRELNGAQPGQPSPEQAWYCAITSNFDPDTAATQADPEVMPPLLLRTLADKGADALFRQPNDLVVDVASMTRIDPSVGSYIRERFDFGTSGTVFHCSYFSQPETARKLAQWLELAPPVAATGVVRAGVPPRRSVEQVLKLRSTQPVDKALKRMETARAPWVVVERPFTESGKPVTLRYAHPARLAHEWLELARSLPGATVHDAFELRESRVSPEMPVGAAPPVAMPSAGAIPQMEDRSASAFRTIEMDRGEPVNVVAPDAAPPMAVAPAPTTARRRGQMAKPPAPAAAPAPKASPPRKMAAPPAAAATPAQVDCHFRAETDDEYVVGQVHTVDVTIAREILKATRKASKGATARVQKAKPLVVECMPMLRVSLRDPADARVEIPVPEPGTPTDLRFDLVANEEGPGQVRVQVRQGPLPLVTLTLDFGVVAARTGTRRPVQAAADLAQFPELPRATDELRIVQMQPFGQKTQYRYELRLPSLRVQGAFESAVLDADPAAYVGSIHKRIEERWSEHKSEKEAFTRDLRAIGCELFDELFPLELKQLLWKHRAAIRSVQVLSSEPFIPWELVLLHDPGERKPGPDAAFLGELGVVRWLVNGYPPEQLQLRPGKARYVIPDYPPPNELPGAQEEIAMVEKRFGATPVQPEAEAIYALLEQPGRFDLLHVACHGASDAADIGTARLEMPGRPRSDGSTSEEDVLATTVRHEAELHADGAQPVVVLNACQSARGGYTLKGLGGFAEAFIEAGAGVFVGSSWSIGDAPAFAFVDAFYEQFTKRGKPLAAAAAAARQAARDAGDATWLAYAVYGHPRATVTRP